MIHCFNIIFSVVIKSPKMYSLQQTLFGILQTCRDNTILWCMLSIWRLVDVLLKQGILYDHHIKSSKMFTFQMLVDRFYHVVNGWVGWCPEILLAGVLFIVMKQATPIKHARRECFRAKCEFSKNVSALNLIKICPEHVLSVFDGWPLG